MRLTLLYGGCFLAAGAALLGITYALVSRNDTVKTQTRFLLEAGNRAKLALDLQAGSQAFVEPKSAGVGVGVASGTAAVAPGTVQVTGGRTSRKIVPPPAGAARALRYFQRVGRTQISSLVTRAKFAIAGQRSQTLGALLTESGIALAIMALLSIGLGWLLAGRALAPLRSMNLRARKITADTLHERLALGTRRDELGELASAFDGLLGRLERAFGAQRRFVANASHELRTPITLQRALVEVTLADPNATNEELRRTCERVLAAGEQQERVIEALLALARGQAGVEERAPVDLAVLAAELLAAREPRMCGLALDVELAPAWVAGDDALLERLLANLLDNAIVHNQPGGWIAVQTAVDAGRAVLRVANSGAEVPPGRLHELFEPFRRLGDERTAGAGSGGLGLGLSIVEAIALAHGASISAIPQPAGGLALELSFEAILAPAGAPGAAELATPAPAGA